jgi:hypothetical protein
MIASEAELVAIIRGWAGRKKSIALSTALYQDLFIVGDDAFELFMEITKRYGVSFTKLNFDAYFPSEPTALYYWVGSKLGFQDRKRGAVTVGHLLVVIERGEWFDPPKNPHPS